MKTNEQEIKAKIEEILYPTVLNSWEIECDTEKLTDKLYSLFESQLESRIEEIIGEDEEVIYIDKLGQRDFDIRADLRNDSRRRQRAKLAHLKSGRGKP